MVTAWQFQAPDRDQRHTVLLVEDITVVCWSQPGWRAGDVIVKMHPSPDHASDEALRVTENFESAGYVLVVPPRATPCEPREMALLARLGDGPSNGRFSSAEDWDADDRTALESLVRRALDGTPV